MCDATGLSKGYVARGHAQYASFEMSPDFLPDTPPEFASVDAMARRLRGAFVRRSIRLAVRSVGPALQYVADVISRRLEA